jgi:hypothetical protein
LRSGHSSVIAVLGHQLGFFQDSLRTIFQQSERSIMLLSLNSKLLSFLMIALLQS